MSFANFGQDFIGLVGGHKFNNAIIALAFSVFPATFLNLHPNYLKVLICHSFLVSLHMPQIYVLFEGRCFAYGDYLDFVDYSFLIYLEQVYCQSKFDEFYTVKVYLQNFHQ